MKILSVVGNGELKKDYASVIDASDIVIRFNIPKYISQYAGNKFDRWVIANGNAALSLIEKKPFLNAHFKHDPTELWFPRHMQWYEELLRENPSMKNISSCLDYSNALIKSNQLPQTHFIHFDYQINRCCHLALRQLDTDFFMPSSGFITIFKLISEKQYNEYTIKLFGFNFTGWFGHPWAAEKNLIVDYQKSGFLEYII